MEERKKFFTDMIVNYFGPEGAKPIDYIDQDWPADPWSRGCYGPSMGPGVLTTLGTALRTKFGRIHWAGTETSPVWTGYIEARFDRANAPPPMWSPVPSLMRKAR